MLTVVLSATALIAAPPPSSAPAPSAAPSVPSSTTAPSSPRASGLSKGQALFHRGDFEASIEVLSRSVATARDPRQRGEALLFIGLASAVLERWDDARRAFAAALTEDPEVHPNRQRISPAIVAAFEEVRASLEGALVVRASEPARVFIDGRSVGEAPYAGPASVGSHRILVRSLDDLRQARQDAVVAVGRTTRIQVPLAPRLGRVSLRSHPTGAEVSVDGRRVGRTPLVEASIPAGKRQLTLQMPGYRDKLLAVDITPERVAAYDVLLDLETVELPAPPRFGPDRRDGVDPLTLDFGFGLGGLAGIASGLEPADAETSAVTGGFSLNIEAGVGAWDLVQIVGVLGIETYGPNEQYFAQRAPTAGTTDFVFNEGVSGALPTRLLRLGVLARVVPVRFGAWRPYLGAGYSALPAVGKVTHRAFESQPGVRDDFEMTAELGGSTVTVLAGVKYSLLERALTRDYLAVDLLLEARAELIDWSSIDVRSSADTPEGRTRGRAAAAVWQSELAASDRASIAGGLLLFLSFRL